MVTNRKLRRTVTLISILCCLFIAALDFSIITTAVPSISYQLQSHTGYIWIGSSYLLTSAAVAPVWGKAADVWGRKPALLASIALFAIGSAICGWSQTAAQLIAGRSVQGSAAGGIIVLVNISISDMWDTRHRSMFLASTGVVWGISAGVGPLLGGIFSEYLTWRWAFWINLPFSFAAIVVLFFSMSPAAPHAAETNHLRRMDWVGSVSIIGVTIMILLSLDFGGVLAPWDSPKVLGLLIGGLILLGVFIFWEVKGSSDPLVPSHLLDHPFKVSPLVVCFTHGFMNMSSWYFLPLYFQAVRGASPTRSGVLLMPIVVTQALIGLAAGGIAFRFGWIRPLISAGMALATVGFGLFIWVGTSTPLAAIIVIEIVAALGVGATFQAPLIAYQSVVSPAETAVATALFGFTRSLSTCISVVMGGIVFQNSMSAQSKHLSGVLGPQLAQNFSGSTAPVNVLEIRTLSKYQQAEVKEAYALSMRYMWIMYASIGGLGLIATLFVKNQQAPRETDAELSNINNEQSVMDNQPSRTVSI